MDAFLLGHGVGFSRLKHSGISNYSFASDEFSKQLNEKRKK